jgi:hypothetical protein
MKITNVPDGARYRLLEQDDRVPAGTVFVKRTGDSGYGYYGESEPYDGVAYEIGAVENNPNKFARL